MSFESVRDVRSVLAIDQGMFSLRPGMRRFFFLFGMRTATRDVDGIQAKDVRPRGVRDPKARTFRNGSERSSCRVPKATKGRVHLVPISRGHARRAREAFPSDRHRPGLVHAHVRST